MVFLSVSLLQAQKNISPLFEKLISEADKNIFSSPATSLQKSTIALVLSNTWGLDSMTAIAQNRVGVSNIMLGNTLTALSNLQASLQISSDDNIISLYGKNLSDLGDIYRMADFNLSSINYYQAELNILNDTEEKDRIIVVNYSIGRAYLKMQYYDSALKYLDIARKLLSDVMSPLKPLITMSRLKAQFFLGDEEVSLSLLDKSIEESESLNNQYALCLAYILKAKWLQLSDSPQQGILAAWSAINIAEQIGSKQLLFKSNKVLSDCFGYLNRFEEAYARNRLFEVYRDSVLSNKLKNELTYLAYYQRLFRFRVVQEQSTQNEQLAEKREGTIFQLVIILVLVIFLLLIIISNRRKIAQKNKELKRLNLFKTKLFAVVSHDLRSPISSAVNVMNLLNHKLISKEEIESLLPDLNTRTSNLLDLLNNIFQWAEGQISSNEIELAEFEITTVLKELEEELSDRLKDKNLYLKFDRTNHVSICSNAGFLRVLLRNLIVNAIKFSKSGNPIEVSIIDTSSQIQISVTDTGVGMSENQIKSLFTNEVIHTVGTQGESGSGLGLSLCEDFVRRLGGKMSVESTKGKGSTFTIFLPR